MSRDDNPGSADLRLAATSEPKVNPTGATPQDLAAVVITTLPEWWQQNQVDPKFFAQLRIAQDGGLSEVSQLFDRTRFMWASVNLVSLILNVTFIISASVDALLRGPWIVPKSGKFLLVNHFVLGHIGDQELRPEVFLACFEIACIVFLLGKGITEIGQSIYHSRKKDPAWCWFALCQFFFSVVPDISTFSALRMLSAVTPAILIPALNTKVSGVIKRKGSLFGVPLIIFILQRVVYAFVGFDAFMVKFQETSQYTNSSTDENEPMQTFYQCLAFLNQMLGVVQVNRYVRERLMIYIFGGEDGYISKRERMRMNAWYAMLANSIWKESRKKKTMPFLWFNAVMLSYSDSDFQRLTLNERPRKVLLDTHSAEDKPKVDGALPASTAKPRQVQPLNENP